MGNALEAAKFSVEKGNLGVDTKESLLKGIDEFNVGVQTWKENIDTQRLELKQNTAEKYREAEKKVQENLPSNKTERDLALKALSNYKDQLYANMGLVQAGAIKPEDNLIFQENGKQSFEIIASQINNYAKRKQEYIDRAKGGYIKNKDGTETYVEPKAGAYEAALRDFQDRMGNPEFTNVSFGENGMGKISFYKTKIDPQTSTRVLDLDADGNPQSIQGLEGMSVLAFDRDRNQKADRIYLQKEAQKLIGQGSLLGNTYEEMRNRGLMLGTVEDDMRQNPGLKKVLDTAVSTVLSTPDRIVSVLSDNAISGQESIPVNKAQWSQLTNAQRNETVEYSYTKADGTTATGVKSKYIELVTSQNNQIVPNLSDRDREAAENITRSTLYNSLKKDITDKGTKSTQFDPNSAAKLKGREAAKKKVGRVDFSRRLAAGGPDQERALEEMKSSGLYTIENGFNQILDKSAIQEVEVDGVKRKAEVYQIQTPNGPDTRYVFHTDKDGNNVNLEERTRQTLSLMMTDPTETKDLFDTYKDEGNTFSETYDNTKFKAKKLSTVDVKLDLDTTVSGTGAKKKSLKDAIFEASTAADNASNFGSDNKVLASGLESAVQQALLNSGQKMNTAPKVTVNGEKVTITAVNSNGKTISVTKEIQSGTSAEPDGIAAEAESLIINFLTNINSKGGKYD